MDEQGKKMGFAAISRGEMSKVRMHEYCKNNYYDCNAMTDDKLSILYQQCAREKGLITNLCSENDNLYGVSYMREPVELLLNRILWCY